MGEAQEPSASDNPDTPTEPQTPLGIAYAERTRQLHETRGALAEAVGTLTAEFNEVVAARDALRVENRRLEAELREAYALVGALRNMKVVRWTVWPRTLVYRMRARRG